MKYLNEANFLGIAAEALPAAHQAILSDQPMGVPTDTAVQTNEKFNSKSQIRDQEENTKQAPRIQQFGR